jgi:hypothetical protein
VGIRLAAGADITNIYQGGLAPPKTMEDESPKAQMPGSIAYQRVENRAFHLALAAVVREYSRDLA